MADQDIKAEPDDNFREMEAIGQTKVAPAVGIAALALNMAMKYHDITTIQDGTMYQQYKLEGKNLRELHLSDVFETAMKIEIHLLTGSERIAKMIVDALEIRVEDDAAVPSAGGS